MSDISAGRSARVLTRTPGPILRPFVEILWSVDGPDDIPPAPITREHVLPTGRMHLAFRLAGGPLRLFQDAADRAGALAGDAVVGGARAGYYIRDVSRPSCSVGAQLRPGAAEALFGAPAHDLAARHTPLEDLWGREVAWMREQLMEPAMPHQRIDRLESMLTAHLSTRRLPDPVILSALQQLQAASSVRDVVRSSGCSHRMLISLFRRSVGLAPKEYCRVLRFQRVLASVTAADAPALVEVAMTAGYSDQAHFNREFREFAGVTPTEYRRASPEARHHLRVRDQR